VKRTRFFLLALLISLALAACQGTVPVTPTASLPATIPVLPSPTPSPRPPGSGSSPTTTEEVPRITVEELRSLQTSARQVVIVDTRSQDSYQAGHIAGAVNIPYDEIATRYPELPRGTRIILYCA
jgi:hypothetical protein